jgi:hypothetical protein
MLEYDFITVYVYIYIAVHFLKGLMAKEFNSIAVQFY